MNIRLGDLPVGKWRHLTPKERDELLTAVGLRQETPGKDRVSARSGRAGAPGKDSVLAEAGRGGGMVAAALAPRRSGEGRGGEKGRSRGWADHLKKKKKKRDVRREEIRRV